MPRDWLNENFGDDWEHYTRAMAGDDGYAVGEDVYMFKTDSAAMLFKLRFGGAAQQ
jgi:hypothetical protein